MLIEIDTKKIVITIITIIIILLIIISMSQSQILSKSLIGCWEAPLDYCKEAGLELFVLSISKSHDGYLLAFKDNDAFINTPTSICISWSIFNFTNILFGSKELLYSGNISFKHSTKNFPHQLSMHYYPYVNKLVLFKGKKIYAVLYKNPEASEIIN